MQKHIHIDSKKMASNGSTGSVANPIHVEDDDTVYDPAALRLTARRQNEHMNALIALHHNLKGGERSQHRRHAMLISFQEDLLNDQAILKEKQERVNKSNIKMTRLALKVQQECEDRLSSAQKDLEKAKENARSLQESEWEHRRHEEMESSEESKDTSPEDSDGDEKDSGSADGESSGDDFDAMGSETERDIEEVVRDYTENGVTPDIGKPSVVDRPTRKRRQRMEQVARVREEIMRRIGERKWNRSFGQYWDGAWTGCLLKERGERDSFHRVSKDPNRYRKSVRRMALKTQQKTRDYARKARR
jgi:hypothetical protein